MFDSLRKIFEEFGLAAGLIYCTDRLIRRLSKRFRLYYYELMMQPVRKKPLLPPSLSQPYISKEILEGQDEIKLMPARPEILSHRFQQGARCVGLYKKDQLVGYVWLGFGHYIEDEVRCDFELYPQKESCFDFDLYVFPQHRMGTAFAALWDATYSFLRSEGIDQSFSRMTRFNTASRRAHLRMGSIRIGRVLFFTAFNLQISVSTVPSYFHISISPDNRVQLRLK